MSDSLPPSSALKILVISHGLELGGIERSLLGLLGPLLDLGNEVDLLLFSHQGELMDQLDERVNLLPEQAVLSHLKTPVTEAFKDRHLRLGITRIAVKLKALLRRKTGKASNQLAYLSRYMQPLVDDIPGSYDVALSFQAPHDLVLKHVDARLKIGWVHTDYTRERLDIDFERHTWTELDRIATVSGSVRDSFVTVFPELEEMMFVAENCFDPLLVQEQSREPHPALNSVAERPGHVLCTVGRLAYPKAFDVAIDACEQLILKDMPVTWLAVGYGPEEASLRQKVREKGLEDSFIMVGKQANPYPFMAAADLYVQPSRYEGKAVAVREAQTLGRPVLITNFPTAASQLRDGFDGVICNSTPEALATQIKRLLDDPSLRDRLAANAAANDYSNQDSALDLVSQIRTLLDAR